MCTDRCTFEVSANSRVQLFPLPVERQTLSYEHRLTMSQLDATCDSHKAS